MENNPMHKRQDLSSQDNAVFEYLSKMTARPEDMSYDEYSEMRKLWKSIYKRFKQGFMIHHSASAIFSSKGVMISKEKGRTFFKPKQ